MQSAFISHSTPDDGYVAKLELFLRGLGYDRVFNDSHSIEADAKFWPVIEQGILNHDCLIVVITTASMKSEWVRKEIAFADQHGKKVLPIWIEDCDLPERFANRNVIDFRPGNRRTTKKIAPSRIMRHAAAKLFGRDKELAALDLAWANPKLNVYTLVAWGGAGKTSLVAEWVKTRFEANQWAGVERYFDWSFYSQGTGENRQTSSDQFMQAALTFFGDEDPTKGSAFERGERLGHLIQKHKTLLVLDGIEPLQYPPSDKSGQAGRLKDAGLDMLLQTLAAENPGLCIVTTREHVTNLDGHATTEEQKLVKLEKNAAVAFLRYMQTVGTDEEMEAAWKAAGGHALTLQLLGRFIADAYEDRAICHHGQVDWGEAEEDRIGGRSAFKVMIAYEKWLATGGEAQQRELAVLRLTGLFDRPMSNGCLEALRKPPAIAGLTDAIVGMKPTQWNIALKRLEHVDLISRTADSLDAHPLIREYFAKQLKETQPAAFKEAHSRLFDYLCESTKPHQPDTLKELEPLYEAVMHGCLAGRHLEALGVVYVDRILRGTSAGGHYSTKRLGAFGANLSALAAFFEEPWRSVSPNLHQEIQAWVQGEAAYALRAMGRLTEALQPMQSGLKMRVEQCNWKQAAIVASNLSELQVTLGRLAEAVGNARQSMTHADTSDDGFWRMVNRTTAADALHHSGLRADAGLLYSEAEAMQVAWQPEFDKLYSLRGFQYCEWLLAPAEHCAWKIVLGENRSTSSPFDQAIQDCGFVNARGEYSLSIVLNGSRNLLDMSLNHLTLARTELYAAILKVPRPQADLTLVHVTDAVNGLREAGQSDDLPRGLLTAALYHYVRGEDFEAERYLAETQRIAERGPMPLHLADVHLHRARMFKDKAELAKAAKLIRDLGYGRRYDELADAEEAAKTWA